jgi:hypothetical protein
VTRGPGVEDRGGAHVRHSPPHYHPGIGIDEETHVRHWRTQDRTKVLVPAGALNSKVGKGLT